MKPCKMNHHRKLNFFSYFNIISLLALLLLCSVLYTHFSEDEVRFQMNSIITEEQASVFEDADDGSFEPSGIAWISNTNNFLVVNDKGYKPENSHVSLMHLSNHAKDEVYAKKNYELDKIATVDLKESIYKLEAITASLKENNFFAITSFSDTRAKDDENKKLLSFSYPLSAAAKVLSFDVNSLKSPYDSHNEYIKIEALAQLDNNTLLIGIRERGTKYDKFRYKCEIFSYDLTTSKTDFLFAMITDDGEGISDLVVTQKSKNKYRLYILSSIEKSGSLIKREEVSGHLSVLEVSRDELLQLRQEEPKLLSEFRIKTFFDKPEGLALLPNGKAIVVFDTDGDRKGKSTEGCFPLESNQDYFAVFDLK